MPLFCAGEIPTGKRQTWTRTTCRTTLFIRVRPQIEASFLRRIVYRLCKCRYGNGWRDSLAIAHGSRRGIHFRAGILPTVTYSMILVYLFLMGAIQASSKVVITFDTSRATTYLHVHGHVVGLWSAISYNPTASGGLCSSNWKRRRLHQAEFPTC